MIRLSYTDDVKSVYAKVLPFFGMYLEKSIFLVVHTFLFE
jgi:hypothetical protein